ncbi:MAG: hypothetical protein J6K75_02020 [Erysipelotrichaceae bacterium]|nr:hypothetical protein [Erysipelotrichaceae bacterium]MBQ7890323.1 hypothetical protein [Erysipelotrichaceae bacterium]
MKVIFIFQLVSILFFGFLFPNNIKAILHDDLPLDSYQQYLTDHPAQQPVLLTTTQFDGKTVYFVYHPDSYSVYVTLNEKLDLFQNIISNDTQNVYFHAETHGYHYEKADGTPIEPKEIIEVHTDDVDYKASIYHFSTEDDIYFKRKADDEDYSFRCLSSSSCSVNAIDVNQLEEMMSTWKTISDTEGRRYTKFYSGLFWLQSNRYHYNPKLNSGTGSSIYLMAYQNEQGYTYIFNRTDNGVIYYELTENQRAELMEFIN